ncbi:MAG: HAD-IA family hydrolase [Desulfurococcaceae archaeon]
MGYVLAVASSSMVERINEFLEHFGVLGYFTAVFGVRPGVRGKPEPGVILEVLRETGFKPEETVYVGDKEVDCIAARKAGVDFILVDGKKLLQETLVCELVTVVTGLLELQLVVKRL